MAEIEETDRMAEMNATERKGKVAIPPDPTHDEPYLGDLNYYRLAYQLIAQRQHLRLAPEGESDTEANPVKAPPLEPETLLSQVRKMICWYRAREESPRWKFWVRPNSKEKKLHQFLTAVVEPCVVLAAATEASELKESVRLEDQVEDIRLRAKQDELSYRALYNLACFEATGPGHKKRVSAALQYLQQALRNASGERRTELLQWAGSDPSLKRVRKEPGFEQLRQVFGDLTTDKKK